MPNTDRLEPTRKKVRSESDDPRCTKSKTDNELPSRLQPNIDIEEPKRMNALKERDDPKWTKSKTDIEDPRRVIP